MLMATTATHPHKHTHDAQQPDNSANPCLSLVSYNTKQGRRTWNIVHAAIMVSLYCPRPPLFHQHPIELCPKNICNGAFVAFDCNRPSIPMESIYTEMLWFACCSLRFIDSIWLFSLSIPHIYIYISFFADHTVYWCTWHTPDLYYTFVHLFCFSFYLFFCSDKEACVWDFPHATVQNLCCVSQPDAEQYPSSIILIHWRLLFQGRRIVCFPWCLTLLFLPQSVPYHSLSIQFSYIDRCVFTKQHYHTFSMLFKRSVVSFCLFRFLCLSMSNGLVLKWKSWTCTHGTCIDDYYYYFRTHILYIMNMYKGNVIQDLIKFTLAQKLCTCECCMLCVEIYNMLRVWWWADDVCLMLHPSDNFVKHSNTFLLILQDW